MKEILPSQGQAGTGIIIPSNDNFDELYQKPGIRMQKFLSKCIAPSNILKDDTIRVCLIGDSISGSYSSSTVWFFDVLPTLYPNANFEFKLVSLGGTGSDYILSCTQELINWNPDLVFFMEYENNLIQFEYSRIILREFRSKTNSDICIVPWTLRKGDMDYLTAKDHTNWIASDSYSHRAALAKLASENNAEYIDWHILMIQKLWDGDVDSDHYFDGAETVHPNDNFFVDANEIIKNHFIDYSKVENNKIFTNVFLLNNPTDGIDITQLTECVALPDITDITKSGTWSIVSADTDKSNDVIQSSTSTDYLEKTINGIGFELSHFGGAVGQFGILIDGVAPNTLLKDYQTQFTAIGGGTLGSTARPFKVIVDSNVLSNDEDERVFSITMTSSTAYTLRDVTNATDIRTGALISQDEVFSVTGGQLTVPYKYANVANFRQTITSGMSWQFSIKKNWYNTVDIAADSLTTVTRIFGLERGEHTIKLTVNSGTVNLDSIMELK